jgi:hydrogenase maturation protease
MSRTLILGWGNPGRMDDGLGPAFVDALAREAPADLTLDEDYQLTVEHAVEVARHDRVVFVDADRGGLEPLTLRRVRPALHASGFTTHGLTPGAVLALARDLFGATPEAWLLGVRGYEFDEFGERLTDGARANLERAVEFLREALASWRRDPRGAVPDAPGGPVGRRTGG